MSAEVERLPLIFIKHKMWSTPEKYQELIKKHLVAVHYDDVESINPNDYKGMARNVMKRLRDYCRAGALVAADYSKYPPPRMIVGKIPPNSEILIERFECDYSADGCVYKMVELVRPVTFHYAEYPVLQTCQARLRNNVVHWTKGGIDRWLKKLYLYRLGVIERMPRDVHLLTYDQLEVLCSEYLRTDFAPSGLRVEYLLTPVGRGKKDTDIDGASGSVRVSGQVSFSSNKNENRRKVKALKSYAEGYAGSKRLVLVYFGPKKMKLVQSEFEEVHYIPIEEVFTKMDESGSGIVEAMLPQTRTRRRVDLH